VEGRLLPPDDSSRALFYAGIAFLAGFSERFARDMMAAPTQLLAPAEADKRKKPAATRKA
jgi:hypothetical protein